MSLLKKLGRAGPPRWSGTALGAAFFAAGMGMGAPSAYAVTCARTLEADVVAIDQAILNNRLGASNVNGMMYALAGDVRDDAAGNPRLREDKRPRPLVLRVAAGDCLTINFTNRLRALPNALNVNLPPDPNGPDKPDADSFLAMLDPNPSVDPAVDPTRSPQITTHVDEQVLERRVGFHAAGMQLLADGGILNDGSFVGRNDSSLTCAAGAPCLRQEPTSRVYKFYAEREGVHQIINPAALVGSDANQGNTANGLFGQIIVEPAGAAMYRNTVTEEEMRLATRVTTANGQPILNYEAVYPSVLPWTTEGKAGLPILNMIQGSKIVHTELDAVIAYAGPGRSALDGNGHFPASTYPLEAKGKRNPAYANRLEPFRDFAQVWHDEVANAQAYPGFYSAGFLPPNPDCTGAAADDNCAAGTAAAADPLTSVFAYLLKGVRDKFLINYASGGIGTEILSNRLGVGPMHDCVTCAYEEFFLTHFTVGEIGQLVDIPANQGLETITPQNVINILLALKGTLPAPGLSAIEKFYVTQLGPKATKSYYPGDPANINHSYVSDFVKFRNTHNGFEQHVFHLHNHQWLFNPNDDNSNYIDAQGIGPGMGYTYEISNGGSGNRNKSAGDAIYHCHFYPHFAQGMWYMWRIHDVYETGSKLQVTGSTAADAFHSVPYALRDGTPLNDGKPLPTSLTRALPDGEIVVGVPIPALLPLPGKALPPMPSGNVVVKAFDRNGPAAGGISSQALVDRSNIKYDGTWNPGYPFWIAGIACESNDGAACEQGIVGQRPTTPPLDMLTRGQAPGVLAQEPFASMVKAGRINATQFTNLAGDYTQMHGGLPRHTIHGVASGSAAGPTIAGIVSPVDLTKFIEKGKPAFFPEGGTDIERAAMAAHAVRTHASVTNEGAPASFVLNGRPPVPGAVYSDPCVDDVGAAVQAGANNTWFGGKSLTDTVQFASGPYGATNPRIYRGANMQYDAVLNKVGYHYPQQRITALWEDVVPTITKNKPGEPLVMRLNTTDCAMYHHTNLVPETFEMDDYQLRTPTDIIGQHIHLPKWDLTTTDGAANGWNYEDGTIAGGAIRERIHAINKWNEEHVCVEQKPGVAPTETAGTTLTQEACPAGTPGALAGLMFPHLLEQPHAFFGATGPGGVDWRGTRITLQRWLADPLLNTLDQDRGLGIIFTHDHYGPSSFQQIGLYSTVLVEPIRSNWKHNERRAANGPEIQLGCRAGLNNGGKPGLSTAENFNACRYDGGPTSWQAVIDTTPSGANGDIDGDGGNDSFREFYFEYTDFQHAYEAGVYVGAGTFGQHNGQFDEKAYIAALPAPVGPALVDLFYPAELDTDHPAKGAEGLFPAFAPGAVKSDTFRFAIAPPLILPVQPIFPDLTVEAAVLLGNGALSNRLAPGFVTGTCIQRPCPTSIDFLEPGMFVVNMRNEPVSLRVLDPNKVGPDGKKGAQADDLPGNPRGDLAFALSSQPVRAIAALNRMPVKGELASPSADVANLPAENKAETRFPPHINFAGFQARDPFTPLVRVQDGDRVRIKAQAGGDEEEHAVSVHGVKWLQAGSGHGRAPNSGWKGAHAGGISEQFTMNIPVMADFGQRGATADYLYAMDMSQDGMWNGDWGIMRSAVLRQLTLAANPANPNGRVGVNGGEFVNGVCPRDAPRKVFNISAVLANNVLAKPGAGVVIVPSGEEVLCRGTAPGNTAGDSLTGCTNALFNGVDINTLHAGGPLNANGGTLIYNSRTTPVTGTAQGIAVNEQGVLHDPTAIMYVRNEDLVTDATLPGGRRYTGPTEPLVLRFNAGDCVTVNLTNRLPTIAPDLPNYNDTRHAAKRDRMKPEGSTVFGVNHVRPSSNVGFHLQLVEYDVTTADGTNVGTNPTQTAAPGQVRQYAYYAGDIGVGATVGQVGGVALVRREATPVEFGGVNILPADKFKQPQKGLYGQAIVEPQGATISHPFCQPGAPCMSRATADITNVPDQTLGQYTVVTPDYRDFASVQTKMKNTRWASGAALQNESEEGPGLPENAPHTILGTHNYRTEPTSFRFGIPPLSAAGGAACSPPITAPKAFGVGDPTCFGSVQNAGDLLSNVLTGGADPQTPIWVAVAGTPVRLHSTVPNSSNRAITQQIHGHVWARDPYLASNLDAQGFPVQAAGQPLGGVGSVRIGDNPMRFFLGTQESLIASSHWTFVLPSAGGVDAVPGDYLIRDTAAAGFGAGNWNILRVEAAPAAPAAP